MTGSDPMHPFTSDDVAAYALGALDHEEAATLARHLEGCEPCRAQLAGFQAVVDVLPLTAPAHAAPRSLHRRTLRRAAAQPAAGRSSIRRALRAPAVGLAAVVAAAAIVVGLELSSGSTNHVYRAQVTGRGSAELRVTGGHGELIVHDVSPPPAGEIYEVWLRRAGGPPSPTGALFSVTTTGSGDVGIPGSLNRVSLVMVTPEPDGGTRVPTHPPVISVSLS